MATHVVEIPNAAGRVEVIEPGMLSGLVVKVDGRPLAKSSFFSTTYPVPLQSGGTAEMKVVLDTLRGGFRVESEGFVQSYGEKIPALLAALAFLPFALVAVGGALGGGIGGLGWGANRLIAAQAWPLPVRAVAMLGVTVASFVVWFGLAAAFALAMGR